MGRVIYHPLAPLIFFSAALAVLLITYMMAGLSPSVGFQVAASAGWAIMAVLAIVNDARRRRLVPCYDFGLYCWVSFPLTVTWYCLWSRKWRGLLLLTAIFLLWCGPYLLAMAVWWATYGH